MLKNRREKRRLPSGFLKEFPRPDVGHAPAGGKLFNLFSGRSLRRFQGIQIDGLGDAGVHAGAYQIPHYHKTENLGFATAEIYFFIVWVYCITYF